MILSPQKWLAIVAVTATALCVGLWAAFASTGRQTSATVVTSPDVVVSGNVSPRGGIPQPPFRPLNDLSVFRAGQTDSDKLPAALADAAQGQAVFGSPRPQSSRRLIGNVYAWPMGATALCVGIHNGDGGATDCAPGFSEDAAIGPSVTVESSDSTQVAGIVADNIQHVRVQIGGDSCTATVNRNGFLCALHGVGVPTITPEG